MDLPARRVRGPAFTGLLNLKPGLTGHAELVGDQHTAPRVGSGKVRVLATPVMINLIEAAALDAVESLLPPGYQSLGTVLHVRHIAATPVGMRARARWKWRGWKDGPFSSRYKFTTRRS